MCYLVTESPPTSINLERAAHKKLHTLDVRDLSLTQAFYKLLDENKEYCVLSTLYRIFRARGLNARRAPTREVRLRNRPTAYSAEKPNEVWT